MVNKSPKPFSLLFKHNPTTLSFSPDLTTPFPTLSKNHEETNSFPPQPLLEKLHINLCPSPKPVALHKLLLNSDGLFLFDILPRIHLSLVGFRYKSTLMKIMN